MNGSLIVRLVDITLLLLLSLMAAASFTTTSLEIPVTHELEDGGMLPAPMQIGITPDMSGHDGGIYTQDGTLLTLDELGYLIASRPGQIEFIADAQAPAERLLAAHAIANRLERQAAFLVRQQQGGTR